MSSDQQEVNRVDNFPEFTSLHGPRHVYESEVKWAKGLWIIVILACLIAVSYQITLLICAFHGEETASILDTTFPKGFPTILLCPSNWINVTKASADYGLTANAYFYLTSIFSVYPAQNSPGFKWLNDSEQADAKIELQKSINIAGNIDNLLLDTALDPALVVNDMYDYMNQTSERDLFLTAQGVCYRIYSYQVHHEIFTPKLFKMLNLNQRFDSFLTTESIAASRNFDVMAMGPMGVNLMPTTEVILRHQMHYSIKVTYAVSNRLSLRRRPCTDWEFDDYIHCIYQVSNEICKVINQYFYIPGENQTDIHTAATLYDLFSGKPNCYTTNLDAIQAEASEKCFKPCRSEMYTLTAAPYDNVEDDPDVHYSGRSIVYITFANPLSSMHVQEKLIYTPAAMISNIGGSMGLWLGASMMSVVEMVYYFTLRKFAVPCKKSKKSQGQWGK